MKREQEEKHKKKLVNLKMKYKEEEEEKLEPPPGMETLNLSIFNRKRYDDIQMDDSEVPVIGNTETSEEERAILKKHPKFAIPQKLEEEDMMEEMERAYSIMRMELQNF